VVDVFSVAAREAENKRPPIAASRSATASGWWWTPAAAATIRAPAAQRRARARDAGDREEPAELNKLPGIRALLTRDADFFIPLRQRYEIAEKARPTCS
jgi:hypothetical protein